MAEQRDAAVTSSCVTEAALAQRVAAERAERAEERAAEAELAAVDSARAVCAVLTDDVAAELRRDAPPSARAPTRRRAL